MLGFPFMADNRITCPALGHRRLFAMAALACVAIACADRGAELSIVYRGDVAAERARVVVRVDSGDGSRVVTPAFPSAAHPLAVRSSGRLPIEVTLLAAGGDTVARQAVPAIAVTPRAAYTLAIAVGRRPASNRCVGEWRATAIAGRADSLYVSLTSNARGSEPPRCDG
jgi:hypothetical protein